ncbi:MAG: hypothetical protein EOM20_08535 [Spartobacteria bacterium]|nr:hypothetical protein [Spartobacteria bacterium]
MKTIRTRMFIALIVTLVTAKLPATRAEANDFNTFSELSTYYLQQRAWIAPIIPPFLPSTIDTVESMILKGDYSFQDWDGWYFGWSDGPHSASGELADYDGQTLIAYEDLASASIKIVNSEGKLLTSFASEPFPYLGALKQDEYERALMAELNRRSVTLWFSFAQPVEPESSSLSASPYGFSGGVYAMMSMGGSNELEVIQFELTNSGMLVTFAWPEGGFTNRLDIYSSDGGTYNGFGSWQLADVGYSTTGTNELRWLDLGQLGRGNPQSNTIRFYTAGNADIDSDGDGYSSAYEQFVLNTDPDDADTDNDGISDGPLAVGGTSGGPDPYPLNSNIVSDVDGDGIDDDTDTDDDNDGLLDTVETNGNDRIIPVTIAPFKVCSVLATNPPGDDSGEEQFDISSSGRMLPYASGGDARRGYGSIHGGIYFNHDATNLYIGVAGFEKSDDPNVLMLFLDTDGTNGGVSTLSGLSGNPSVLGTADNLAFGSGFTPNVALLVGARTVDGMNDTNWQGRGQGVYSLSSGSVSDFPGFSSTNGAISQWGDRGTESANAGIEVALSLSALGVATGDHFSAAAMICGGDSSPNRHFSGESYGKTVSGTLDQWGNFGFGAVTLTGAKVYLSSEVAPGYSEPPPVDGDDVILQGYIWNVPGFIQNMSVAGSFNSWNAGTNNMTLTGYTQWEYIHNFTNPTTGVEFKFAANGNWDINWGDDTTNTVSLPINYQPASQGGGDIALAGTLSGFVRFRFNSSSARFSVESVASGTTTGVTHSSTNFWYKNLADQAQTGALDRFTMIWMPPPQKSSSGRQSVGYDPFDYYDLGAYNEKGSVETRYGSKAELKNCLNVLRSRGIRPIIDLLLNHNQNGESGADKFKFLYSNHDTFEKQDPTEDNGNDYFYDNTNNAPFHYEYDFGRDVSFEHPYQRQGLKAWGDWVTAEAGYQGYRWDLAFNIDPWFISEFLNSGLKQGRFSVLEWWEKESEGTVGEMETYLALTDYRSAFFDMPLREELKDLCEVQGSQFDISVLAHAGLVSLQPEWSVPFLESHDTIRPYGQDWKFGISKDKHLGYAFALLSEGTPMVPISDYLIGPIADMNNPEDSVDDGWTGTPMKPEIDALIDIRRAYAAGGSSYLSTQNTNDLFVMKRTGNASKPGCILVINDNDTTTLSDSGVNTGWTNTTTLVDVLDTNHTVSVTNGVATLSATSRSYRVYIRQEDL